MSGGVCGSHDNHMPSYLRDKGTTEDEYKSEIEKLEKRLAEYEDLVDKNVRD